LLPTALVQLITRPADLLVRRWNWKSAASSSLIRAMIFFFADVTAGWRAALGAVVAEYCYRALTSGFYALFARIGRATKNTPWLSGAIRKQREKYREIRKSTERPGGRGASSRYFAPEPRCPCVRIRVASPSAAT